jgi:hypothetical protein
MESISIKVLNELLSADKKHKYIVNSLKGHQGVPGDYRGSQDEYNETFEFYKHPEMSKNIFMRITTRTDSYGGNDFIHEIQFVEGKEKTITIYEPIN